MDKLCFLSKKNSYFYATITKENQNVVKIIFEEKPNDDVLISGFEILNENNNFSMSGEYYYNYNTIYKVIDDNTVLLSNDGSVYTIPSSTEIDESSNIIELTEEEKSAIEKQNQINELKNKIRMLKNELLESDYIVIKCQEYLLVGKEIPSEYDISSYNEKRDSIREQINELQLELEILL